MNGLDAYFQLFFYFWSIYSSERVVIKKKTVISICHLFRIIIIWNKITSYIFNISDNIRDICLFQLLYYTFIQSSMY